MYNYQLKTFIVVAENGSFSKAAENLFISPTAVMKQINALEQRLGVTLFDRTKRGLELTNAGKCFLYDAKYVVDYAEKAIERAKTIDERENQKSIRIGTSIMTPVNFILDIWTDIQVALPDWRIELISFENTPENAREILKNLGKHIDVVAGIYDEWLMKDRGFQVAHLSNRKISVAVPVTHPLASKERITLEELKGFCVMFIKEGFNAYLDEARKLLSSIDVKIIDFDFFSISAFNLAVIENVPIVAVKEWKNIHPLLKIIPVIWDHSVPYGVMYSQKPTPQVKKVVEVIKNISDNRFNG